jgi:uncharacterized SAM-binding protein YcdF (DUF218 family)
MFLFKKVVSQFFFPMPICLGLCFTGLALLWWSKKQKAGKILVTSGLLLLTALSYAPVADALLRPLENQYPPYVKTDSTPIKYVVVLGGGHNSDPRFPVTSQIGDESLKRLVEGIRIYRQNPGSKLVLSGGTWRDRLPNAVVLAENAKVLGVARDDIIIESESVDTADEAQRLQAMVSTNSIVLVTSATHMPRSVGLFRSQGISTLPASAEHLTLIRPLDFELLFPSGRNLRRTERAVYEYLGLLWETIRGHL